MIEEDKKEEDVKQHIPYKPIEEPSTSYLVARVIELLCIGARSYLVSYGMEQK